MTKTCPFGVGVFDEMVPISRNVKKSAEAYRRMPCGDDCKLYDEKLGECSVRSAMDAFAQMPSLLRSIATRIEY